MVKLTPLNLVCFVTLLLMAFHSYAKQTVVLATFEYPPLMFEHRDETGRHGLGVEAVMRAFEHSQEFQLEVEYFPVKRAIYMFEKRRVDLFLGSRLDVAMAKDDFWPFQITSLRAVLFCHQHDCDKIRTLNEAFNAGVISTIPGSPINVLLESYGNRLIKLQKLPMVFNVLFAGRSRYAAAIDFAGHYVLRKMDTPEARRITKVGFDFMTIPYDLLLIKNKPYSHKLATYLQENLVSFSGNNDVSDVIEDYLYSRGYFNSH